MSIRRVAARTFCAFAAVALGTAPEPVSAADDRSRLEQRAVSDAVQSSGTGPAGLVLKSPSERALRVWRGVEEVVAAPGASGVPRSPTLGRLWEWARSSSHVIRVEMVEPSEVANGIAGLFTVERVDPAGRRHVVLIRVCPQNIRRGRVASSPNASVSFVRFAGLDDDAERYAEVLAHELAHAEHVLESEERVARIVAAQRARADFLDGGEHSLARIPAELRERLRASAAFLATVEAHAEAVEAAVLAELVGPGPATTADRRRP